MTTSIAASRRLVDTDGAAPHASSPAEDRARVDRMVDAVRRLGEQLETTHRTLDVFVERLSDAARAAQAGPGRPALAPPPARAARPAVGMPVRRPVPVDPDGAPTAGLVGPPAGLAEHVRAPGAAPDAPVTH